MINNGFNWGATKMSHAGKKLFPYMLKTNFKIKCKNNQFQELG